MEHPNHDEPNSYPIHPEVLRQHQRMANRRPSDLPSPERYVPHPHSPEGRVDRMEEQLIKLLSSLSHFAQVGELTDLHADLHAQLAEYAGFREEVRVGSVYRYSMRPSGL